MTTQRRPPEFIERIREMAANRMTDKAIGEVLGLAGSTITYHRKSHNIPSISRPDGYTTRTAKRARRMEARRERTEVKPPCFEPEESYFTGQLPERPDRDARYARWSCQYVTGQSDHGAVKCGDGRLVGYPYCEHHARLCIKAVTTPLRRL